MKALSLAAVAAALLVAPIGMPAAIAGTVALDTPGAGATLHSGEVAMSMYYTNAPDGGLEVVVTYAGNADVGHPSRIIMKLSDGDSVTFGLPGESGTLYEFTRSGDIVTVSDVAGAGY